MIIAAISAAALAIMPRGFAATTIKATTPALAILGVMATPTKAHAQEGWYEVGGGWAVLVLNRDHAREYGRVLTQSGSAETRLRNIALKLAPYAPGPWTIAARIVAYATAYYWYPLRWRIEWCANRSNYVYIYHWRSIPVWAYTTW